MIQIPFNKTFTPHPSQTALLQARGMHIPDMAKAERCLERIGYYRLSAYWYPFRKRQMNGTKEVIGDDFFGSPSFDDVVDFYVFDKNLRLLTSDALERIEVALRSQIAHRLGARHPMSHRQHNRLDQNFITQSSPRKNNMTRHQDWLSIQDQNFNRSKEDFAKHFRKKYSGLPPIWIATEVWDWGMLSHFYAGMKAADRNGIAALYGDLQSPEMEKWVRAFNDIRNICAHHSRLWNRGLKVTLRLPNPKKVPELDHIQSNTHSLSRLYGSLVAMALMMKKLHPQTKWHHRMRDFIISDAPKHPSIGLHSAGFPNGWQNESIWQ